MGAQHAVGVAQSAVGLCHGSKALWGEFPSRWPIGLTAPQGVPRCLGVFGGNPQTFGAVSAFSSLSRSQSGLAQSPASSLKTLAGTGRSQAAKGETQNGSSEIRTQDQSVKSRLASPENLVAEMVSAKLSQEKSQEPAQWNLIIAHP